MAIIFLFLYLVLYLLLSIITYSVTIQLLDKIKNLPPSPFPSMPLIGHLYMFSTPMNRFLFKMARRYGPVILLRMGSRKVLVVTSPEAAEECLTKNDVAFAGRPRLLAGKHLGYEWTSILWAPYGDHWRNIRRISSLEILSNHRLQTLSHIRANESRILLRRLADLAAARGLNSATQNLISGSVPAVEVDMKRMFFELTMNVMMRMIAGTRYYGVSSKADKAEEFVDIVRETYRTGVSDIGDFVPLAKLLSSSRRKVKKLSELHARRDGFMQSLIEDHRRRGSDPDNNHKTMVEVLLSLQQSQPEYYKDEIIRGLMVALLNAGADTSAGTMEWGLALLLNHPKVISKLRAEIDNVIGNEKLMEESDFSKLPYLHQVVKEILRLYPPGPVMVPHESMQDCVVSGYHVPRGTMLLVNLWSIQRDPKLWDDPEEFKPERFDQDDDARSVREGFKMMPFGSGRRSCPGESLAMRVVGKNLGLLVQCFEWDRVGDELVDMTEGLGLLVLKGQPLIAKCRPRPSMAHILSQIVLPK